MKRKRLQSSTVGSEGAILRARLSSPKKNKRNLLRVLKMKIGGADLNAFKGNNMYSTGVTGGCDIITPNHESQSCAKDYIEKDKSFTRNEVDLVVDHILWTGSAVWKIPFHTLGPPQRRTIRLKRGIYGEARKKIYVRRSSSVGKMEVVSAASPLCLEICDPKKAHPKASKDFPLGEIVEIKEGCQTPTFHDFIFRNEQAYVPDASLCFSIVHGKRTFDLYAETSAKKLIDAMHVLARQLSVCVKESFDESCALSNCRNPSALQLDENRFFDAVVAGDQVSFRWFLDNVFHVDIMKNDETRDTALISACRVGRENIAHIALQYAAKNDPHPNFGSTALQVAVSSGHLHCVQLILKAAAVSGADSIIVNHEDSNKDAPIHIAARCGSYEIAALLVSHGANTNLINFYGRTCLHCSAMQGSDVCLRYLLDIGCDSLLEERDDQGMTCLHLAVKGGRIECTKILINRGSNLNAVPPDGSSIFQIAQNQMCQKMIRTLSAYASTTSSHHSETSLSNLHSNWVPSEAIGQPTMIDGLDVSQMSGRRMYGCNEYLQANQSHPLGYTTRSWCSQRYPEEQRYRKKQIERSLASDESTLTYDSSDIPNYDTSTYCTVKYEEGGGINVCHDKNSGNCDERRQATGYPLNYNTLDEKRFKVGEDWWYICNSSGHPYYLRSRDKCCQWQDPRLQQNQHTSLIADTNNHTPQLTHKFIPTTIELPPAKRCVASEGGDANEKHVHNDFSMSSINENFDGYQSKLAKLKKDDIPKSPTTEVLFQLEEKNDKEHISVVSSGSSLRLYSQSQSEDDDNPKCSSKIMREKPLPTISQKTDHYDLDMRTNLSQVKVPREMYGSLAIKNTHASKSDAQDNHEGGYSIGQQEPIKDIVEKNQPAILGEAYKLINPLLGDETKAVACVQINDRPVENNITSNLPSSKILQSKIYVDVCDSKYSDSTKMLPAQSDVNKTQNKAVDKEGIYIYGLKYGSCSSRETVTSLPDCDKLQKDAQIDVCNDSQINTYIKMSKVGVPTQSVIHKMKKDGVDESDIARFKITIASGGKYTDSSLLCFDKLKKEPKLNSHSSCQISKYAKMIQVGVPIQSTINKMVQDGIGKKEIACFESKCASNNDITASSVPNSDGLDKPTRINLQNDSLVSKYIKMVQVGVPARSVLSKMHQDGVSLDKVQAFEIFYDIRAGKQNKKHTLYKHVPAALPVPPLNTHISRRTSIAMQKIHWKTVSEEKLPDSLWAEQDGGECNIDDNEIEELESLFGAKSPPISVYKKRNKTQESGNKKAYHLIELKRANNIAISLAQFRVFPNYDDLCKAVISFDLSKLTIEKLQNMQKLLPSNRELIDIRQYKGSVTSLGRAELFFLAQSKIPRFPQKLDACVFSLQFVDIVNELKKSSSLLVKACIETVNNKKLAGILRRILAVGNLVNEGAGKLRAGGITVDSLIETANKKGRDGRTSVLDHVVMTVLKQDCDNKCVDFWKELKSVEGAANIDVQSCKASFQELQLEIKKLKTTLKVEESCLKENMLDGEIGVFLEKIQQFLNNAHKSMIELDLIFKEVDTSFDLICSFFAEDRKACQASKIFKVLLKFAKLVDISKESWLYKQRADKRRATMNIPKKKICVKFPKQNYKNNAIEQDLSAHKTPRDCIDDTMKRRRISFSSNLPPLPHVLYTPTLSTFKQD